MVRGGAGIFRLAAIDLDGTLLSSDDTIGERTKRAARETSLDIVLVAEELGTPLLTWAGLGVAMGNAHADVLAIADEVTATNDEDGVALVLDRLSAA